MTPMSVVKSTKSICTRTQERTRRKVRREQGWHLLFANKADDMSTWDEEKLRSVVTQQESKQKTTTDVRFGLLWLIGRADMLDRVQVLYSGCRGSEIWLVVSLLKQLIERR